MFFYCWLFIVLKNRPPCSSTKILHGYQRQENLFVAIAVRTDPPNMLLPMGLPLAKWLLEFLGIPRNKGVNFHGKFGLGVPRNS